MIKHFLDYVISSIIELKIRIFTEIGFASGAILGFFSKSLPGVFIYFTPQDWITHNMMAGFINGLSGAAGALVFAIVLRGVRRTYLRIKDRIQTKKVNGKCSTNS